MAKLLASFTILYIEGSSSGIPYIAIYLDNNLDYLLPERGGPKENRPAG